MGIVKSESPNSGKRSRRASIVLVMLIIMVLTIAGMSLFFMSYHSSVRAIRLADDTACMVLTDAGLRKAIGTLNAQYRAGTLDDNNLPVSSGETLPASEGTFSYQITKDASGVYVVTSVGARGNFRRTVVAQLHLATNPYFDHAILVKGMIDVSPGMTVAAYDPADPAAPIGTYTTTIGTLRNDKIGINVAGTVYGDAFCGDGGDPDVVIAGKENVTGSTYALTDEPEIVRPEMPTDLTDYDTDLIVSSETVTLTPADSGIYNNLKLSSKADPGIVVIDGGTVKLGLDDNLQMGNSCEIIVNEGSTLILYIDKGISTMTNASISYNSATPDPTRIQLYGTGNAEADGVDDYIWTLKSKDVFQGVIYAPDAFVTINSGSKIIGAIVASSFSSASGIDYLYDISLRDAQNIELSGPSDYDVDRWSESLGG